MISYAAKTDKGILRKMNQDYYHASAEMPPLFIVCDGMGGHASGDVASRSAVDCISRYIDMHKTYDFDSEKAHTLLSGALKYANSTVYTRATVSERYKGMGTTADICLFDFDFLYICHVGDSRVYLFRDGKLKKLTTDHTLIEELLSNGTISEQEAENHPNRHMITRAVGTDETVTGDFLDISLSGDDIILMCSDGLSNMVSDAQIIRCLSYDNLQKSCDELIKKANDNGGRDNITAVVIKYETDEEVNN